MTEVYIELRTIASIREFVNTVVLLDYEVDLLQGRYVIDAKSIMGIFALDLLSPIRVVAHTENTEDFLARVKPFFVEKQK